jgi:hypothetical protein
MSLSFRRLTRRHQLKGKVYHAAGLLAERHGLGRRDGRRGHATGVDRSYACAIVTSLIFNAAVRFSP